MLENFHFIHPWWLLATLPLALLAWRAVAPPGRENAWQNVVDARLMPLLQVGQTGKASRLALWLLVAGWLIATLALADPTWARRPQPVFQTSAARVVVLDLSDSMSATDLKPSRLVRARYKLEDVLAQGKEGQTGLVAYAGDAFAVSPLTRDANTIRSLLKVLEPDLMPAQGDRADLGLARAGDLLRQAGLSSGQILLMADGVDPAHLKSTERAAARLHREGYTVSVLGIGTEAGAPVVGAHGALARDAAGQVVVSRLDPASLESVAHAGDGEYRTISDDGAALRALLATAPTANKVEQTPAGSAASSWTEQGPWLVLLLLPFAALAFRRNWLLGAALAVALAAPAGSAEAATWADAWQRPDQQAAQALAAGDYANAAKAAAESADPKLQGSAAYKLRDYKGALAGFTRAAGADADYNRGNALAQLERYPEAIAAYDKSLAERPADDDARANKAAVEALLKRQQQQQTPQQKQQPSKDHQGAGSPKSGDAQTQQGKDASQSGQTSQGQQGQQSQGQQGQRQDATSTSNSAEQGQPQPSKEPAGEDAAKTPASSESQKNASASKNGDSSPQSPAAQDQSNAFAQAVKKLGATDQQERPGDGSTTNGTPRAGAADPSTPALGDPAAGKHEAASSRSAQPLKSEERVAAEQWLRRIPDDPGGLLRRKFLYQYRQRQQQGASSDQ